MFILCMKSWTTVWNSHIKTAIPGKVEENAYKSALALHVPADSVGMVIEPDNEDADLTSFLALPACSFTFLIIFWR